MTTNRHPIPGLKGLPHARIVDVDAYLKEFTPERARERSKILRETFGCLSEEDGKAFAEALAESRKIDS